MAQSDHNPKTQNILIVSWKSFIFLWSFFFLSPWCFYFAECSYRKHDSGSWERKCTEKRQGIASQWPFHPAKEEQQPHETGRRLPKKTRTRQQSTCEVHRLDLWSMSPVVSWKRLVCFSCEDGPHKGQRSWIPHARMLVLCLNFVFWSSL